MDAPPISGPILWFFRRVARRYFARQFHSVLISNAETLASLPTGPLVIYANHGSWWDPLISILLAAKYMPDRKHYAPMDEVALRRYSILRKVGVFGVDIATARGAVQFLRTGLQVLQQAGVLWITPQGKFADARARPLLFKPGLAALAGKAPDGCTIVPLAIEYIFWDERLPEALLRFGDPIVLGGQSAAELDTLLKDALLKTMDELASLAVQRDPTNFEVLQRGKAGTGGFYEVGQRFMARVRRQTFQAEHTPAQVRRHRG